MGNNPSERMGKNPSEKEESGRDKEVLARQDTSYGQKPQEALITVDGKPENQTNKPGSGFAVNLRRRMRGWRSSDNQSKKADEVDQHKDAFEYWERKTAAERYQAAVGSPKEERKEECKEDGQDFKGQGEPSAEDSVGK